MYLYLVSGRCVPASPARSGPLAHKVVRTTTAAAREADPRRSRTVSSGVVRPRLSSVVRADHVRLGHGPPFLLREREAICVQRNRVSDEHLLLCVYVYIILQCKNSYSTF